MGRAATRGGCRRDGVGSAVEGAGCSKYTLEVNELGTANPFVFDKQKSRLAFLCAVERK